MNDENSLPAWLEMRQALSWVLYRDPALPEVRGFYGDQYGPRGPDGEVVPEPPRIGEENELRNALQTGSIRANRKGSDGRYHSIPPLEWMDRNLISVRFGSEALVSCEELLSVFPRQDKINGREGKQSSGAQPQCEQWLATEYLIDPKCRLTKEHFWDKARNKFGPKLSRRAFGRAWDNTADEDRKNPGRKKKS